MKVQISHANTIAVNSKHTQLLHNVIIVIFVLYIKAYYQLLSTFLYFIMIRITSFTGSRATVYKQYNYYYGLQYNQLKSIPFFSDFLATTLQQGQQRMETTTLRNIITISIRMPMDMATIINVRRIPVCTKIIVYNYIILYNPL